MSSKKPNSWIQSLKMFNEGSNTWCIPKKGSKQMKAVKNLHEYNKLSDDDKKKYFKASPISKEGLNMLNDKKNEEKQKGKKTVYPYYEDASYSKNEYRNYIENIIAKSHKEYYGDYEAKKLSRAAKKEKGIQPKIHKFRPFASSYTL